MDSHTQFTVTIVRKDSTFVWEFPYESVINDYSKTHLKAFIKYTEVCSEAVKFSLITEGTQTITLTEEFFKVALKEIKIKSSVLQLNRKK